MFDVSKSKLRNYVVRRQNHKAIGWVRILNAIALVDFQDVRAVVFELDLDVCSSSIQAVLRKFFHSSCNA